MSSTKTDGQIVKRPVGRPEKYTKLQLEIIRNDLFDYITRTPDPTISAFTSYYMEYPVNKQFICDRPEFSDLVKMAIEKQEAYLVSGATQNKLNATFAIFRLKQPQHGWTDKSEVDNNLNIVQPILNLPTDLKRDVIEMDDNADIQA